MANTIARTIIEDGDRNAVVLFTILGDGSGDETAALVLDYSALSPEPGAYNVSFIYGDTLGCGGTLKFDADTDAPFQTLAADAWTRARYQEFGGIPYMKVSGAGRTGDIVLSTQGLATGNSCSIVVGIKKGLRP